MKELIKEAEKLYKNIDETQSHLIKARLDKDRIREHLELIRLETIVFDAKQLLKCIIDRKDNIVDLGEVWHEVNNEPNDESRILIIDDKDDWYSLNHKGYKDNDKHWENVVRAFGMTKWAYLKDLLPEGGE